MGTEVTDLDIVSAALSAAVLLERNDEERWAATLSRFGANMRAASDQQERAELASSLLASFRGMGSLNDVVLQSTLGVRSDNAEFDRLRSRLYRLAISVRELGNQG